MDAGEFVAESVDEDLLCTICCNVMVNPRSCAEGHAFCAGCIRQWLMRNRTCPIDRKKLSVDKLTILRPIDNMIGRLEVFCSTLKGNGSKRKRSDDECNWIGKLCDRESHVAQCRFVEIQCPWTGCNTKMPRSALEAHLQACSVEHLSLAREQLQAQDKQIENLQSTVDKLQAVVHEQQTAFERRLSSLMSNFQQPLVPGSLRSLCASNFNQSDSEQRSTLVQVTDIRPVGGEGSFGGCRYRLMISDSQHCVHAMLATQLNSLVDSGQIALHSVFGVEDALCNVVGTRRIVIVLSIDTESIRQQGGLIGNPRRFDLEDLNTPPRAASASAPAAAASAGQRASLLAMLDPPPPSTELAQAVRDAMGGRDDRAGTSVDQIVERVAQQRPDLSPAPSRQAVRAAIDQLCMEGSAYSTVDEDHFALTSP